MVNKELKLGIDQRTVAWNAINLAKKRLETGLYDDVCLANYMLRDLDATEEAGLSDLVWSLHSEEWGIHKNDVLGVIDHLEAHLLKYGERVGDK